jgi:type II secretory ATPase GspE/PulE/Tfp pilus assembly ATPase PilB-like protein
LVGNKRYGPLARLNMKYKGMKTLFEDGLRKTEEGITTIEEIIKVTGQE